LKTIPDIVIKKKENILVGIIPGSPMPQVSTLPTELPQTTDQRILLQCLQHKSAKVKNKTVYYEERVECQYLWPENQRRVHSHTAKLEPNRVTKN
jgi:hypothetical protein